MATRQIFLMWRDILRLYGVMRIPGDDDPLIRDLILHSTARLLDQYGEEWILKERESLLNLAKYLASSLRGLS